MAKHFTRPAPPEPVERVYSDAGTGSPRPDNESVEMDRAARDLSDIRAAERDEIERQHNAEVEAAVDDLRRQVTEQPPHQQQQQPAQEQQPDLELQPEQAHEQAQAAWAEADRKVEEVLADPLIRGRFEQAINHERQQAAAQVELAKATFQHVTAQNATAALAVLTAQFPEFAGLSGPQLEGALKVSNPQRAEAFRHLVGQVNTVVATYQQHAAQQQAQQRQQAEATFRQFAAEQDARTLANDPPETVRAIRDGLLAEAKAAGISEQELITVYNTNSAMRHSFVQNLIADGMRYRLAQRSVSRAASRPIPNVVRPGSSAEVATRTEAALAEARSKLKPEMSAKEAAQYLIARRAAR